MKEIYYLSDNGRKLYLDRYPFWMQTGDFLDYEWIYTVRNNRIIGFEKEVAEKDFKITVFGDNEEKYGNNWNLLHEIFETDIHGLTPGRLYFGEYYLSCYVFMSEKSEWEYDCNLCDNYFRLVTDYPFWIKEATKQFLPQSSADTTDGLDFPFDFAFDFASDQVGLAKWSVDHYAPSDFQMIIYGPCTEPRILINGHPYQIHTELEASDYLIIDSRKNTVTKYLANGTTVNLYNSRNFKYSVFEKIPAGDLTINWSGDFGFDITLYLERSEPKWGTS